MGTRLGRTGLAAFALVAGLAFAACSDDDDGSQDQAAARDGNGCSVSDKKVVYVSVLRENPILRTMAQGFIDGAKRNGFKDPQWLAPQGFDEAAAASLGSQAIAQGVDGIVVFATSPAFYPMIRRAEKAGIPVVQTHSIIEEGKAPGVRAVVAPDPKQYGAAAAEAMGNEMAGKGKVAIAQSAFIPNENAAAKAFTDTMREQFPDVDVLEPQVEGGDPPKAIAVDEAIIQANADLTGAFSTDGNGPVTWASAARDQKKDLTIIGMDYAKANLDLVKKGEVFAIVAQPLYEEHDKATDVMKEILCGESPAYLQTMDAPVVTKDGLDKYYEFLSRVKIR